MDVGVNKIESGALQFTCINCCAFEDFYAHLTHDQFQQKSRHFERDEKMSIHGIGNQRVIQPGDIVSLEVGIVQNGWIGDNALTVPVGEISLETKRLLAATEQSLYEAISFARPGLRLADLCGAVEAHVKPLGFSVVREFVGHGVGRDLHEEPQVPNYRPQGKTPILEPGMTLAIEPMVNAGVPYVKILADGWTVVTEDRKPSAHFEHTVLITDGEPEILTDRPRTALPEQLGI